MAPSLQSIEICLSVFRLLLFKCMCASHFWCQIFDSSQSTVNAAKLSMALTLCLSLLPFNLQVMGASYRVLGHPWPSKAWGRAVHLCFICQGAAIWWMCEHLSMLLGCGTERDLLKQDVQQHWYQKELIELCIMILFLRVQIRSFSPLAASGLWCGASTGGGSVVHHRSAQLEETTVQSYRSSGGCSDVCQSEASFTQSTPGWKDLCEVTTGMPEAIGHSAWGLMVS